MVAPKDRKYLTASIIFHLIIFLAIVLSYEFSSPLMVVENTNKNDVISAVVLGDTVKSKILPQVQREPVVAVKEKPKPVPVTKVKPVELPPVKKDVIALKKIEKKKPHDIFGKDLLADLEKLKQKNVQQQKLQQQKLKAQMEKKVREQAELTMRKHLLDEDIKMAATESRDAQGIVNKYTALILQSISEHWVVPSQGSKKLSAVLLIRLAPGGQVLDVQIVKSSGDTALDNSARAAVFKASPLPVPTEPGAFAAFRQFNLKAKPKDLT